MSAADQYDYLECPHCGDVAAEPDAKGLYWDGANTDGGCKTCGFPGQVSCDSETPPWWSIHDDNPDAKCRQTDCEDCHPRPTLVPDRPGDVVKLDITELAAATPADIRAAQILEQMEKGPRPLSPEENAFFLKELEADRELQFMLDPKLGELTVDKLMQLGAERRGPKKIVRPDPLVPMLVLTPTEIEIARIAKLPREPKVIVISGTGRWSAPTNGADLIADLRAMRGNVDPSKVDLSDWRTPPSIFEAFVPTSPATFPPVMGIDFAKCGDDRSVLVELQAGKVLSMPPLGGVGPISPEPTTPEMLEEMATDLRADDWTPAAVAEKFDRLKPVTADEFTARRKQAIADLQKTDVPCVDCGRAARLHTEPNCDACGKPYSSHGGQLGAPEATRDNPCLEFIVPLDACRGFR